MNTKRLQQALNTIAMGFAEAAEALHDAPVTMGLPPSATPASPGQGERVGKPAMTPDPGFDSEEYAAQPSFADESVDFALEAQGSLTQCPKHRIPYKEGNFGPFCTSKTDDQAWANAKGYCRITPRNAAQWLRMQAA